MFDRAQYVIERKQSVTSVFLGGFAGVTFEVKDVDGNLLGCFKKHACIWIPKEREEIMPLSDTEK